MNTLQRVRGKTLRRARFVGCRVGVAVVALMSCASYAFAAGGTWNTNSGSWNTAGNWTPNTAVPGTAAGDVVGLTRDISSNVTVTLNTAATLGTLNIGDTNATHAFTLTSTTGGTLTFNNNGSGASLVQVSTGLSNTISTGFTLADNLTVTASTTLVGRPLTISGNIVETGSARNLTKSGSGAVMLSGANTYTGTTAVNAGILQFVTPASLSNGDTASWIAARITTGSGGTFAVSVGASNFTTGNVTTLLTNLGGLGGSVASGQGLQAGSSMGFDTSNAGGSFTIADAIRNSTGAGGGAVGVVKLGSGTLSLSGLSSTAANNYTGTTVIDQGTLVLAIGTKLSGGLTFGNAIGGTTGGMLDLSNGSAEFGGTMLVRSLTETNSILIGAGQSLVTKGNVQIGDGTGLSGLPSQSLSVQGSGTWNVTASNGTFRVGNAGSSRGVIATLDASGLDTLMVDLRLTGSTGGSFVVNENLNGGAAPVAKLAATSTIKANSVSVQSTGGSGTSQLLLGTGQQLINANALTIGNSTRSSDIVQFQDSANGSLILRNAAGTGRAAIALGNYSGAMSVTSGTYSSTLDVVGHAADMLISSVTALDLTATVNQPVAALLLFDSGTFDATAVTLGRKQASSVANIGGIATLSIGGTNNRQNTFLIGTLNMAVMSSTAGTLSSVVNISGATTSGTISSGTFATTSTTGGVANGTMNISGGSTTITNGITLVSRSGTPGTATGTLNITGGSLSVGGNVATAGSGGTVTSTVLLDGGSLDLNGFALGGSGQLIDNLNIRSGTLANVGGINNGAGFVKTTAGTLVLMGTSAYTGLTTIEQGQLVLGSNATGSGNGALGTTTGGVTIGSATGSGTAALLLREGVTVDSRTVQIPAIVSGGQVVVLGGVNTSGSATFGSVGSMGFVLGRDVTLQAATGGTVVFDNAWSGGTGRNVAIGSAGNAGTVQLGSALAVTGVVSVANGTLQLASGGSLADAAAVVVGTAGSSGVVLDVTDQVGTFASGSTQTLSGIGTLRLDADTPVSIAGIFSPGNSPGLFTFDGSGTTTLAGTTLMEIEGVARGVAGGYDAVNLTNGSALVLGGALQLWFSGTFAQDTPFQLFTSSGAGLSGNFTGVSVSGSSLAYTGLTWSQNGSVWNSTSTPSGQALRFNSSDGTLVVVPEPATLAVMAMGLALGGWASIRRRR